MERQIENLSLDSLGDVELLMAIEDAFGITIKDDEALHVYTMGDLQDLCVRKLGGSRSSRQVCLSMVAFHRLRRGLVQSGFSGRHGPSTNLRAVVGGRHLVAHWSALAAQSGLKLPALVLASESRIALWSILGVGLLIAIGTWSWIPLAVAVVATFLGAQIFLVEIPAVAKTLRDLTLAVVSFNFGSLGRQTGVRHEDDIWQALKAIAANQVGVAAPRIGRSTRFY